MHHQTRPQRFLKYLTAVWLFGLPVWGAGLKPIDEARFQNVLQSHRGKIVLVDFWATWCEPCRTELPILTALAAKLHDRGFVLVTISADEPEQEREAYAFLRKTRAPMPGYLKSVEDNQRFIDSVDSKWSGALPALFLYDRRGQRVKSFIGETESAGVEAAVRKLL